VVLGISTVISPLESALKISVEILNEIEGVKRMFWHWSKRLFNPVCRKWMSHKTTALAVAIVNLLSIASMEFVRTCSSFMDFMSPGMGSGIRRNSFPSLLKSRFTKV